MAVAVDAKVRDVEKMPDKSIDVCLFNGSIRTSEQEYMAQLLRKKAKVLVAFGSCAHEGCIPGLANVNNRRTMSAARRALSASVPTMYDSPGYSSRSRSERPE